MYALRCFSKIKRSKTSIEQTTRRHLGSEPFQGTWTKPNLGPRGSSMTTNSDGPETPPDLRPQRADAMLRPEEIKSEETTRFSECDVCGEAHETSDCPHLLPGKRVENARAPSRARLTLPSNLRIKKPKEDDDAFAVVARENVGRGTRFGPFEAQVVYDSGPRTPFPLKIFERGGGSFYLDTSNEEECNWMFFVPAARTRSEQNLMAFQLNRDIYYGALRDIRIHEELRVWYAPHYAKKMAVDPPWPPDDPEKFADSAPVPEKSVHRIPAEESQEPAKKRGRKKKVYEDFVETPDLDDLEDAAQEPSSASEDQREWRCSQCGRLFRLSADFARHLRQHYDPRKSGDGNGRQKRAVRARPKNFGCQFCDAKFSSSKLLQRHRLRLHRRQLRGKKEAVTVATDIQDGRDVEEETGSQKKKPHISDTDAASILLEIEANVDKPEEGPVEPGSEPVVVVVIAENEVRSPDVEDTSSYGRREMEYLVEDVGSSRYLEEVQTKDAELVEETKAEDLVEANGVRDLADETMFLAEDFAARFSCDICEGTFNTSQDLYRHIGTHVGGDCPRGKEPPTKPVVAEAATGADSDEDSNAEHVCPFCQKSFAKSQLLRRHVMKHTGEFTCHECGKSYCSKSILRSHVCSEKPEERGSYSCEICHKAFSKESYLEKHIPVHTGAHACPNCGKWLRSNDSLNNHIRICWQVKELETTGSAACPHCKQVFTDTRSFRRHMYDHTHLFMCTNCGARFRNKVSEMQHLCNAQRVMECDVCEEKFPNVAELNKHKSSHGEEPMKCDGCGKTFHAKDELSAHRCSERAKKKRTKKRGKAPPNLQPLICEVCGSLFSSTSSLNVHKRLHGEKLFSCDLCGKQFHRKDLMLDHCAVHGEAAVPCPLCSKMFKTKKSLDVHMLIHDDVKRFACNVCGKRFHQKGNLLKHEEVHNPERKYPCSFCSKMFSTKEYLAIHVLEHTRGRVHACDTCDKSFVKEHQLRAHQRVFHTNLAYVCAFCGLSVKLKHSLKRHLNKKHPDQRLRWSSSEQIAAMLVTSADKESEEEQEMTAEGLQLVEDVGQVQDGTEVLLAVAGIGSEALQQALASGTARIQQGSLPNTIEISLPVESEMAEGGATDGGDELRTRIIHLPLMDEMDDGQGELGQTVDVIERMRLEAMETRITVLSGEEPFQQDALAGGETIMLDNGTILQQGVSQDGTDVLFYVLTAGEPGCGEGEACG